jgi:hypothetical protein
MGQTLRGVVAATPPQQGLKPITASDGYQLQLQLASYLDWRELIYEALRDGVDISFTKREGFADDVGKPNNEISLRLRHADSDKGYPQLAPIDYLANIAMKPGGLEHFLSVLAEAKGFKLVPMQPLTSEQKLRLLVADMTDKQRRRFEKDNNLPAGDLDR